MPLHLLGKKSWNVYNADNIARVQRDEAAAAAEEHAAEQRMQDADAARRLAILRGDTPPPLPEPEQPADPSDKKHTRRDRDGPFSGGAGRKRKRAGEDDTDFEMRVARERAEEGARVAGELAEAEGSKRQKQDVSIVDSKGHIDLVGPLPASQGGPIGGGPAPPNETDSERIDRLTRDTVAKYEWSYRNGVYAGQPWYEQARRKEPVMKALLSPLLSHACEIAAGRVAEKPESEREHIRKAIRDTEKLLEGPTTSAFGQPDPKRKDREAARLDANDPLAAMRSGAKQVRDVMRIRRGEAEDRWRELEQLRKEERRREKREKRERARADEGGDEDEDRDGRLREESHRSGRSERRRHGDERRRHGDERHESRRAHVHREERRRRREDERARDRDNDREHGRERERSRDRETSSRSHRDRDRHDRHGHRGKDHERRDREAKRAE